MNANISKATILDRIEREINNTKKDIGEVGNTVRDDIQQLLYGRNLTDEQKRMFEEKHFESLKKEKTKSLESALTKLEYLKDQFLIDCSECEN